MNRITPQTFLVDLLNEFPEVMPVLARQGFHITACIGEGWMTIEQIARSRGIPLEPLLEELNRAINSQ